MEYVFEHARMEQNEKMRVLVQLKHSIQSITSLVNTRETNTSSNNQYKTIHLYET